MHIVLEPTCNLSYTDTTGKHVLVREFGVPLAMENELPRLVGSDGAHYFIEAQDDLSGCS